jgi:hypothetical protein
VKTVIATTIFTRGLDELVPRHAPSVSAANAEAAGSDARGVRLLLPKGSPELPGLLLAYAMSLDRIFYLLTVCSGIAFFVGTGMGWVDVRKNKPEEEATENP